MLSIKYLLVRLVVGHSRPSSVGSLNFVFFFFFMYRYRSVTWDPSTPEGLWHCIGSGNTFPVHIPHRRFSVFRIRQCHRLSGNRVVRLFMPASGARHGEVKLKCWVVRRRCARSNGNLFAQRNKPRYRRLDGRALLVIREHDVAVPREHWPTIFIFPWDPASA